ncbi:hypothetical protein FB451DRAFT_1397904 [Mycena latifolia]|nr:hypothetical protein FB451DRAFT_1397904 [Mycena latifolia]
MPALQSHTGKRVYLRVGALGADRFKSALQHFKQSVVLSRALNSTLIVASEQSEHHYSTSQIFNRLRDEAALDARNACRMKDHLPQERRNALVRGWCAGEAAVLAEIGRIQAEMAECTGIVDVDGREITEDLNGCGDTGTPGSAPSHFRGSTNVPALVRVLADIRASQLATHRVRLTIAMENAEARVLAELHKTNYALLDSGDAIADMHALAAQDILLLGESPWAVIVHLVAPPGLTVVEFSGGTSTPRYSGQRLHAARLRAGALAAGPVGRLREWLAACATLALLPLRALLLPASGALSLVSSSLPTAYSITASTLPPPPPIVPHIAPPPSHTVLSPRLSGTCARLLLFWRVPATRVTQRTPDHAAPRLRMRHGRASCSYLLGPAACM